MTSLSLSVPGKTILFGEHAVVYEYPAIAVPLNSISMNVKISARPTEVDTLIINNNTNEKVLLESLEPDHFYRIALNLIIKSLQLRKLPALQIIMSSTIPIASGLGSSAAFAVCLTRSISGFLGFKLSEEQINEIAFMIETFQHGTPSGIDNTVITFNKPVYFKRESAVIFLELKKPLILVIADTGLRSVTKDTVAEVRLKKDRDPVFYTKLLEEIESIVVSARNYLENGNHEVVGKLMAENHKVLQKLGVSCFELDHLVDIALKNGSLGAKLCGSGKGGNIVAITDDIRSDSIKTALLNNGATNCFVSKIEAFT